MPTTLDHSSTPCRMRILKSQAEQYFTSLTTSCLGCSRLSTLLLGVQSTCLSGKGCDIDRFRSKSEVFCPVVFYRVDFSKVWLSVRQEEDMADARRKFLELRGMLDSQVAEKRSLEALQQHQAEADIADMKQQWEADTKASKETLSRRKNDQKALSVQLQEHNRSGCLPSTTSQLAFPSLAFPAIGEI